MPKCSSLELLWPLGGVNPPHTVTDIWGGLTPPSNIPAHSDYHAEGSDPEFFDFVLMSALFRNILASGVSW